jgi:hypothetical protein
MRILKPLKLALLCIILFNSNSNIKAQSQNYTLNQDPKFEQILNEKRKINTNLPYNDRYKIQIYNGPSDAAKKTLNEFKQEFKNTDGTIIFNTPNYKVWVGNFRTRMEAERNLVDIKKKYKTVFLIKPSKS